MYSALCFLSTETDMIDLSFLRISFQTSTCTLTHKKQVGLHDFHDLLLLLAHGSEIFFTIAGIDKNGRK